LRLISSITLHEKKKGGSSRTGRKRGKGRERSTFVLFNDLHGFSRVGGKKGKKEKGGDVTPKRKEKRKKKEGGKGPCR